MRPTTAATTRLPACLIGFDLRTDSFGLRMTLDPQTRKILDWISSAPPLHLFGPVEARQRYDAGMRLLSIPAVEVGGIEDLVIPGPGGDLPARLYRPLGAGEVPLPVLVWFHGGGFVVGSVKGYDPICRRIANTAGVAVVSLEYRLAPEHPFPAAVEDALAATSWIAANAPTLGLDPTRLGVGGDSAGGNLSAVTSLLARDCGGPAIAYQFLLYPGVGTRGDSTSMTSFRAGYFLEEETIQWFMTHYLPEGTNPADRRHSPLLAEDLSGLPPALVVTAGFDPLRDDGATYAERLRAAGGSVDYRCYDAMIHGFLNVAGHVDAARDALDDCARAVGAALASNAPSVKEAS